MGKGNSSKVNETQGFLTLGHSNWIICSLLSWFCSKNFQPSWLSYWEVQFLITPERGRKEGRKEQGQKMGKRDSSKSEWDPGIPVLGALKSDHLQPVKLILFHKISIFLPFILGSSNSYYPRERKMGKRDTSKSKRDTGVSVLGLLKLDHLQPVKLILFQKISIFQPFILESPISYYPREREMGKRDTSKSKR